MSEWISPRHFYDADGVQDWRVVATVRVRALTPGRSRPESTCATGA